MKNIKSIYPRLFHITSPQMLSFMHDLETPLVKPDFKVELIDCNTSTKPIDYSQIDKMDCNKVGEHIKDETV